MNRTRFVGLLAGVGTGVFLAFSPVSGDEGNQATLADVHKILLQAAGYQSATPPTVAQQTELLNKAITMLKELPHIYHGELKVAGRAIEAALSELRNGDPAHKAKGEIYEADDAIKSIM